jgi:hypothetical protein
VIFQLPVFDPGPAIVQRLDQFFDLCFQRR